MADENIPNQILINIKEDLVCKKSPLIGDFVKTFGSLNGCYNRSIEAKINGSACWINYNKKYLQMQNIISSGVGL